MPDFNNDRELGQGKIVYAVRNAHKGLPIKKVHTGKGDLELDSRGRCIVKDHALAAEIRKEYPHDLAVSRLFVNDAADRGHRFHFGQMPEMPWKIRERLERELQEFEEGYAKRSGVTVEWLHSRGQFGAPCDCGEDGCSGWQMTSRHFLETEPIYKVFNRWIDAPILEVTPEEAYKLSDTADFYGLNNYLFDGQPQPQDGEIGYNDSVNKRIVISRRIWDTEPTEGGETAQAETPAEAQRTDVSKENDNGR
jgi:hypothetical protein